MKSRGVYRIPSCAGALFERGSNPRKLQSFLGARMGRRTGGRASISIRGNWPRVSYSSTFQKAETLIAWARSTRWPPCQQAYCFYFLKSASHPRYMPSPMSAESCSTASSNASTHLIPRAFQSERGSAPDRTNPLQPAISSSRSWMSKPTGAGRNSKSPSIPQADHRCIRQAAPVSYIQESQ